MNPSLCLSPTYQCEPGSQTKEQPDILVWNPSEWTIDIRLIYTYLVSCESGGVQLGVSVEHPSSLKN